jgi:hypothetical protein
VAGIAITANPLSIYLTISQLSIGKTMTRDMSFGRPQDDIHLLLRKVPREEPKVPTLVIFIRQMST